MENYNKRLGRERPFLSGCGSGKYCCLEIIEEDQTPNTSEDKEIQPSGLQIEPIVPEHKQKEEKSGGEQ